MAIDKVDLVIAQAEWEMDAVDRFYAYADRLIAEEYEYDARKADALRAFRAEMLAWMEEQKASEHGMQYSLLNNSCASNFTDIMQPSGEVEDDSTM